MNKEMKHLPDLPRYGYGTVFIKLGQEGAGIGVPGIIEKSDGEFVRHEDVVKLLSKLSNHEYCNCKHAEENSGTMGNK